MSDFFQFHKAIERLPIGVSRVMPDQIGAAHTDFKKRNWLVADGYVQSRTVSCYGIELDEDIVVDEDTENYSFHRKNSCIRIRPRSMEEITVFTPNISGWLRDLTDVLEFEDSKRAKVQELIAGHLWHLGDMRVPRSSRTIPVYIACQLMHVKELVDRALESRVRPDCGIVFVARREDLYSPFNLPRGHQIAGLDEVFWQDGLKPDKEVIERISLPQERGYGSAYFEERSGVLLLAHFHQPRSFSGKQRKVIAYFWKHRAIDFMKWSDVVRETDCGKDPGSVFGPDWLQYLERSDEGRGRYRIRASKS